MKKTKIMAVGTAAVLAVSVLAGCGGSAKDIGQDEVKKIAFEDAGVSESEVSRLIVEKERDDGILQYDVQFDVNEKEYSYDINGSTGEILSADVETNQSAVTQDAQVQNGTTQDGTVQSGNAGSTAHNNGASANVAVSEADAKEAALDRVPGAAETDLRMELEFDDGYYIYEGDIIYQQKEYEFEIDAQTGSFLKWSEERHS